MQSKIQHLAGVALLVCAGCAVKQPVPATWRLTGRVLMPPGVATEAVAQRTVPVAAPGVRGACTSSEAVALVRKGSRLTATVNRDALGRQVPGWLARWTAEAEAQGCLPPGTGLVFADRILEAVPMGPGEAYRLLHASHARTGFVELGAGNRLEVITPIRRAGADAAAPLTTQESVTGSGNSLTVTVRSAENVIAVETAWYTVRASGGATGYEIVPLSAEWSVRGRPEPRPGPEVNLFAGAQGGFYRLLYKTDQTEVVLTARTRAELDAADPDTCGKPRGAQCIAVPRFVGVNPYVAVQVNGAEVRVPAGGSSLRAVVRAAGRRPEDVMGTLAITKPFGGRQVAMEFDRGKQDVMDLVLMGNETVRW